MTDATREMMGTSPNAIRRLYDWVLSWAESPWATLLNVKLRTGATRLFCVTSVSLMHYYSTMGSEWQAPIVASLYSRAMATRSGRKVIRG